MHRYYATSWDTIQLKSQTFQVERKSSVRTYPSSATKKELRGPLGSITPIWGRPPPPAWIRAVPPTSSGAHGPHRLTKRRSATRWE
jgi:hypothetical protein